VIAKAKHVVETAGETPPFFCVGFQDYKAIARRSRPGNGADWLSSFIKETI
jgi:hypothetical protein